MACFVITGASSGIGQGLARGLPSEGDAIVLVARREERLSALAEELSQRGVEAHLTVTDVRDPDAPAKIAAAAAKAGGASVLINNAGGAFRTPLEEISMKGWRAVMGLNLDAPFAIANALFSQLKQAGNAQVINVGSVAGAMTNPGLSVYAVSKAALDHLTRHQAREWAQYGIRANVLAPGPTDTEGGRWGRPEAAEMTRKLVPLGRAITVEEIVDGARYLISATAVTGEVLNVDGGFLGFMEELEVDL